MSASGPYCGDHDSQHYMHPIARAEAVCDGLRSGARDENERLTFCICRYVREAIEAALANPQPVPATSTTRPDVVFFQDT